MSSDSAQQIKERLDIVDFLRPYLNLLPAGRNLKANCPFHKEKTPSFMVSPERQTWHCFGCSAGGDIFAFLMRYENLEFIEALKILAERAGVDIGRVGNSDQKQINILYEVNKAAKDYFKKQLISEAGRAAIEYLKKRGLSGETAAEFEIGFASDSPDALHRHLIGLGYQIAAVEKAGLVFKTDRGTYVDRFRNRIMFPILNHFGKPVGFTGRIMPGFEANNVGKYINSPETPIFNKSKILYGFDKSKNVIRESKTAVLVEGQMDFVMAWQDGVKILAATSGTALTAEHMKTLRRVAENLVLSFDQDEAGQLATERAIDLANREDLAVRVLKVPTGLAVKDPADIALAKPGLFTGLIAQAQPAMDYYFERYKIRERTGDWKKNLRVILAKIKFLASPLEQAHWLKEAVKMSGIEESYLREEIENLKMETPARETPETEESLPGQPLSRKEMISQRIASLVVNYQDFYSELKLLFTQLPENYQKILAYQFEEKKIPLTPDLQSLSDLVSLRSGLEVNPDLQQVKKEFNELLRHLQMESLKERRQAVSLVIQEAEKKGEDPIIALTEKQKIAEEIRQLEGSNLKGL